MSIYVRVKRKNSTLFISCEPTEKVGGVKKEVATIVGLDPRDIKFLGADKSREVPDAASIADQDIKNDGVLYMVYRNPEGGGDAWEDVDVDVVTGSGQLK